MSGGGEWDQKGGVVGRKDWDMGKMEARVTDEDEEMEAKKTNVVHEWASELEQVFRSITGISEARELFPLAAYGCITGFPLQETPAKC